jgi:hypothetical protein
MKVVSGMHNFWLFCYNHQLIVNWAFHFSHLMPCLCSYSLYRHHEFSTVHSVMMYRLWRLFSIIRGEGLPTAFGLRGCHEPQTEQEFKQLACTHPVFQKEEAHLDGDSIRDSVPLQSHLLPLWHRGASRVWLVEVGSEPGTRTSAAAAWVLLALHRVHSWGPWFMSGYPQSLQGTSSSQAIAASFHIPSRSFSSSHPTMQRCWQCHHKDIIFLGQFRCMSVLSNQAPPSVSASPRLHLFNFLPCSPFPLCRISPNSFRSWSWSSCWAFSFLFNVLHLAPSHCITL